MTGKVSYFRGNDATHWRTNLPTFAKVKYGEVYPNIDLVYYGNQHRLEYDFIVSPGADPKSINLSFDGLKKMEVDQKGNLVLHLDGDVIQMHKPVVYQTIHGLRREIEGRYLYRAS